MRVARFVRILILGFAFFVPLSAARAELVISELIVDLQPPAHVREDIEVWNNSPERSFVAVEPREIVDPMLATETARRDPDPERLGLLVSPSRMILEPGQRKLVRIAALGHSSGRERVYRVTVKPVVGEVEAEDSGLKLLVGYDVLVLVRPASPLAQVSGIRVGKSLAFSNQGNVSVEIVGGRQCRPDRRACKELPGKRLYPGASWSVAIDPDLPVEYVLKSPGRSERRVF